MVEFFAEWIKNELMDQLGNALDEVVSMEVPTPNLWMIYMNGTYNSKGPEVGIILFHYIRGLIN